MWSISTRVQVLGFLGLITCAMVPTVLWPAWKAYSAGVDVEHRGVEAGFQKSAVWGSVDKK
jgi:hypothetical protein